MDTRQGGREPSATLSRRGVDRWRKGHPWIYQVDIAASSGLQGGEIVRVLDGRGWFLGRAMFSKQSKIALRWMSFEEEEIDSKFFADRLRAADAMRKRLYPQGDTYRIVHGEADRLPGLVVDRYARDFLSVQFLVQGMELRKGLIVQLLQEHFEPKAIVNRSDVTVRVLEGLKPESGILVGSLPERIDYTTGDVSLEADLLHGQKTGAFLDQRENQIAARDYASGDALDAFSYSGGFATQIARSSTSVTAVEISAPAIAQLKRNLLANNLNNVTAVEANAFDFLHDAVEAGKKYDTVVLDPPSFAKNKASVDAARRGYKEINLRAMQLLNPGGMLISASCTYHIDEQMFEDILQSAAADAKRQVQIIERRGASRDHPVLLSLRETRYLKCFFLRVY